MVHQGLTASDRWVYLGMSVSESLVQFQTMLHLHDLTLGDEKVSSRPIHSTHLRTNLPAEHLRITFSESLMRSVHSDLDLYLSSSPPHSIQLIQLSDLSIYCWRALTSPYPVCSVTTCIAVRALAFLDSIFYPIRSHDNLTNPMIEHSQDGEDLHR
jgi:hypothetical protein